MKTCLEKCLIFSLIVFAHAALQAMTPQQYCEKLEARSANSYELLNIESSSSASNIRVATRHIKRGDDQAVCGVGISVSGGSPAKATPLSYNGYGPCGNQSLSCVSSNGIRFPNGNSCVIDSITNLTSQGQDGITSADVEYTTVDGVSQYNIKFCSKGIYHFATVQSGPLSNANDIVTACVRGSGTKATPGAWNASAPQKGQVINDVKGWLVDKNGCN